MIVLTCPPPVMAPLIESSLLVSDMVSITKWDVSSDGVWVKAQMEKTDEI
jgi:hypothetical protein